MSMAALLPIYIKLRVFSESVVMRPERGGKKFPLAFHRATETGGMGIVRTASSRRKALEEEFHRTLAAFNAKRKDEALDDDRRRYMGAGAEKLVCVTSGASYVGIAIVNQLLNRGYSVRLALDNIDDLEKLREMELSWDEGQQRVSTLVVKLTELNSLCNAFDGCHGLWLALGKTMAEKAAWDTARDRDVRFMTICPGLITGPQFRRRNSTASIAYLKGANAMYKQGLLATVDVSSVAKANISVYEEIGNRAGGRYICFDRIIDQDDEAIQLEQQMEIPDQIAGNATGESPARFQLSNRKLSRLSLEQPCCFDDM
ncbi:hypothetical protein ACLOJK_032492 [Asimina triloba]